MAHFTPFEKLRGLEALSHQSLAFLTFGERAMRKARFCISLCYLTGAHYLTKGEISKHEKNKLYYSLMDRRKPTERNQYTRN